MRDFVADHDGIRQAPFRVVFQNTALLFGAAIMLPTPNGGFRREELLYKGADRRAAMAELVRRLRTADADVIALCEVWDTDDANAFARALSATHPHVMVGPDEVDAEPGGGLVLLSRHPLRGRTTTIFRQAIGEDAVTNKGVLAATVTVPGDGPDQQVFVTHLQSPGPMVEFPDIGPGSSPEAKVVRPLQHLRRFVEAARDPTLPALLVGDLNADPATVARELRLAEAPTPWAPRDVVAAWTDDDPTAVVTFDERNRFDGPDDRPRHERGSRLDYAIAWAGTRLQPILDSDVLVWTTPNGLDVSDHYGVRVDQAFARSVREPEDVSIERVEVTCREVACLQATTGPTGPISETFGADEVEFTLRGRGAGFDWQQTPVTRRFEDVVAGDVLAVEMRLRLPDPGDFLELEVLGFEVDEGLGIETGRQRLSGSRLRLGRAELARLDGRSVRLSQGVLRGDGAEYTAELSVRVA